MEHCLETLFIEIKNQEVNLVVGVVYRRPHTDFKHFLDKMKEIIEVISEENKHCIITGDFNVNLLKNVSDPNVQDFLALFNSK